MTEPIIPPEIKKEVVIVVKEELSKRDYSWIRRDWIVVGVLFILLAVMNITNIVVARDARDASTRALQIAEQTEAIADSRHYLQDLAASTGICAVLTSGAINTGEIVFETEAIENYYNQCLVDRAGTPPVP